MSMSNSADRLQTHSMGHNPAPETEWHTITLTWHASNERERQTHRQRHTERQRQTDRQTDRQASRQAGRLTDRQTETDRH